MAFDLPQSIDYGKPRKPSKKVQFDKNYGLPKPKGLPKVKHEEAKAARAALSACHGTWYPHDEHCGGKD